MDSNQSFHTLQKQLFQSMRFNILETQISRQEKDRLHSAYVYAWKVGVFPAQQDYYEFHRPYDKEFIVNADMIDELTRVLDSEWSQLATDHSSKVSTFYNLEARLSWSREQLIFGCRYLCQSGLFGEDFWQKVVAPGEHPIEAACITGSLTTTDFR